MSPFVPGVLRDRVNTQVRPVTRRPGLENQGEGKEISADTTDYIRTLQSR